MPRKPLAERTAHLGTDLPVPEICSLFHIPQDVIPEASALRAAGENTRWTEWAQVECLLDQDYKVPFKTVKYRLADLDLRGTLDRQVRMEGGPVVVNSILAMLLIATSSGILALNYPIIWGRRRLGVDIRHRLCYCLLTGIKEINCYDLLTDDEKLVTEIERTINNKVGNNPLPPEDRKRHMTSWLAEDDNYKNAARWPAIASGCKFSLDFVRESAQGMEMINRLREEMHWDGAARLSFHQAALLRPLPSLQAAVILGKGTLAYNPSDVTIRQAVAEIRGRSPADDETFIEAAKEHVSVFRASAAGTSSGRAAPPVPVGVVPGPRPRFPRSPTELLIQQTFNLKNQFVKIGKKRLHEIVLDEEARNQFEAGLEALYDYVGYTLGRK